MNAVASFEHFTSQVHAFLTECPNACVSKGVNERLDDLPDPSLAALAGRAERARELLRILDGLRLAHDDLGTALDADLARLLLESEEHNLTYRFNDKTTAEQMPCAGDDVGDGIFVLFVNDPRAPEERLRNILCRIEKIPSYFTALLERLDTPIARWVAMDVEKVRGLAALFDTIHSWAESIGWAQCGKLAIAVQSAKEASHAYCEALQAMPTTENLHVGDETTRRIVALRGIDKSLTELHEIARRFLSETREQVEALRVVLVRKYALPESSTASEVQKFLAAKYRLDVGTDFSKVLERYETERERVLAYILERDLFPVFAEQDMQILQTPPFMAPSLPAGAMFPAPPFRAGTLTSNIYLTLSEELLAEHTELSIPAMMIHEGIPGHHLQLATAARHRSIIRRHVEAMDQAEGWTTMLEDYMLDIGYLGELTDEARFVGKLDLSRIGARVAIDLFMMSGDKGYLDVGVDCDISSDDPFVAAGNLLAKVTGFVPGRVQAELNWYSQERGYPLCYLTGNSLVWELKRDFIRASEDAMSREDIDRCFHRSFLEAGNMPVSFLRRAFTQQGLLG